MMQESAIREVAIRVVKNHRQNWKEFREDVRNAGIDWDATPKAIWPTDFRIRFERLVGDRHAARAWVEILFSDGKQEIEHYQRALALLESDEDPATVLPPATNGNRITVIEDFKDAWGLEFEGVQFTVNKPDREQWGLKPRHVLWMSDWGVCRSWMDRGLITEVFIPNCFNHADQFWQGEIPTETPKEGK